MNIFPLVRWLERNLVRRLTIALAAAALLVIAFVSIAEEVIEGETARLDRAVSLWFYGLELSWLDVLMRYVTEMGSIGVLATLVFLTSILLWVKSRLSLALIFAAVNATSGLLNWALKLFFRRDRPSLLEGVEVPMSYSFPSGHSMGSIVVYATIAFALARLRPAWRWYPYGSAACLILLIGISRIHLGMHWPSDVLAGFAAGGIVLAAAAAVVWGREKGSARSGAPELKRD